MTQPPQKSPMSRAMPALLIAGSLGGVGVVMVGLLSFIPPVDDGSGPAQAQEPGGAGGDASSRVIIPRIQSSQVAGAQPQSSVSIR